jgi:Leucine-rich repeat (LRR) protein
MLYLVTKRLQHVSYLGLKQLRRLSLSRNAIKSVGRHALTGLVSLEQLDLADNVISTIQGQELPTSY